MRARRVGQLGLRQERGMAVGGGNGMACCGNGTSVGWWDGILRDVYGTR